MLRKNRLLPVVVLDDADQAIPLADAVKEGGLQCIEITLRTEAALTAIRTMASQSTLYVGAGTVLTPIQAKAAVDNGARFIVSPGMSRTLVDWCLDNNVPVIPGCATATELMMALEAGLDTVKFFPAELMGGAPMLKSLSGVFPTMQFLPTGGISAANLPDYLALPQVIACGGSWLVRSEWLENRNFDDISEEIAMALQLLEII